MKLLETKNNQLETTNERSANTQISADWKTLRSVFVLILSCKEENRKNYWWGL